MAGQLSAFIELQQKGLIESRFDCYSRFRWDTRLIGQILEKLKKQSNKEEKHIKELRTILEKALKSHSGLIVYGD